METHAARGAIQVVLCMDTEGPCDDPGNPQLLATWPRVEAAMDKLHAPAFRRSREDSFGNGLKIGWFFLTWTGFATNPRNRDFGYHHIRDRYLARWGSAMRSFGDEECWHYHHPPASGIGNEWGLDWNSSREYAQILSRQILERNWFPACYRAGGTIMDNISSRWIDTWFPIDYSNRSPVNIPGETDWSRAPADWGTYRPDPGDYQRPGNGRRVLARCLDLRSRIYCLSENDVTTAFESAAHGAMPILATFEHDYRDISNRVDEFRDMIRAVGARYPGISWRYATPSEAVCQQLGAGTPHELRLDAKFTPSGVMITSSTKLFQEVPWIAIRHRSGDVTQAGSNIRTVSATSWVWNPPAGTAWTKAGIAGSTSRGLSAVVSLENPSQ